MEDKGKALSDVTATPKLGISMVGASNSGMMMSPLKWGQTPPLRGGTMQANGSMISGGGVDGLSPLYSAPGSFGLTTDAFSPAFFRASSPDFSLTPGFIGAGPPITQQAATYSFRKSAIREEFQKAQWNSEDKPASPGMPESASTVITPGSDARPGPEGGKPHEMSVEGMHGMPQGMPPSRHPAQGYPQPHHSFMYQQAVGMPMFQIQPQQFVAPPSYDMYIGAQKQEPVLHREICPGPMHPQFVAAQNEYVYGPSMERLKKPTTMEVPVMVRKEPQSLSVTSGKVIAKKEATVPEATTEPDVMDKHLQKQIRSRAAASRQRNRQKDYIKGLEKENELLRSKREKLMQANETMRLEIRMHSDGEAKAGLHASRAETES